MHKLMTTDEVADLLNVRPAPIRKWVHLEQIPVVRLGRSVRFKVDAVEKWVNERCQQARTWDWICVGQPMQLIVSLAFSDAITARCPKSVLSD